MKALTVELFLGVLSIAALDGCARTKAEPEPAPALTAPPPAPAPLATASAPSGAIDEAPPTQPAVRQGMLVDAGVERKKARPSAGAQAACGAGGCSADMKKGGK